MKKFFFYLLLVAIGVAAAGYWYTQPKSVDPERFATLSGDVAAGEKVFWAAGCPSCHKAKGSEDGTVLPGGQRFVSPFGTFVAPNISTDPTHGIGRWDLPGFATALLNGS